MKNAEVMLRELERGLSLLDTSVSYLETEVAGLSQSLAQSWGAVAVSGGCTYTFTLTFNLPCTVGVLTGATVVYAKGDPITGNLDPTTILDSGVTDGSGSVTFTELVSDDAAGYLYWIDQVRFASEAGFNYAYSFGVSCGGVYSQTFTAVNDYPNGYGCVGGLYPYPFLFSAFTISDPTFGINVLMSPGFSTDTWVGGAAVTYNCSPCPSKTVDLTYTLDLSDVTAPILEIGYSFSRVVSGGVVFACPDVAGTFSNLITFPVTISGNPLLAAGMTFSTASTTSLSCSGARVISVYEA